ncbi:chaplin [Streptomyces sp. RB6PN25]|uniref:Chaplin n=1 Tax=Streptomyces humicola TaxID=2953240 RepID=A0ABT1PXZ9_9ACTN|nr:chaplin [Streptomyces humicola]MCQ4082560.1 chaplin [Streptomyces humicola]
MRSLIIAVAAAGLVAVGAGTAAAQGNDTTGTGTANNSPGFISGNLAQVPINLPINVCGNTVNVIGALNPAFGHPCVNG